MICISVTPKSRKFAKVDLLNAAGQCDLVELCLDHLIKAPDVHDLVSTIKKPILISCRRESDGGHWVGTEENRLKLLREAIVAGPAYIELELDIADNVRRYGETKRVISYTSLDAPISNPDEVYYQAQSLDPDVVKFSWPTRSLESIWPLLSAVTKHRDPPIVGTGISRAGLMFSLLGQKYGSPWIYAALEKGMEAYPGQPTISELNDLYRWRDINAKTRFVGVCGFGSQDENRIRVFNAGFDELGLNGRCLPVAWGYLQQFGKMLDALKVRTLLVSPSLSEPMIEFADVAEQGVRESHYCDLLARRDGKWTAFNTLWRGVLTRTEAALADVDGERSLDRRNTLIIGANEIASTLAIAFKRRGGVVSIADPDDDAANALARKFDIRHVPFAAVYESYTDILVKTDSAIHVGHHRSELSPSILKPTMTVIDVSSLPDETDFIAAARERGSRIVEPADVFADMLRSQFLAATGKELPETALAAV